MTGDNDIVKEFLVESYENLDRLDRDLLELEKDPTAQEILASIFRTIHTIKGTCGFLGFSHLEKVAHVGENLLSRLREGLLQFDGEPKSPASKKPVVLHPLVMGLLKHWREITTYAGEDDLIFASDRLKGMFPRVPNMLVEDHLRPAAERVMDIPEGHRFGFHNLRHALTSFLVEIGTDAKTIQDMLRWADPSILLKVYAHSRMDKRLEAQAKMIEAMGLNEQTIRHLM